MNISPRRYPRVCPSALLGALMLAPCWAQAAPLTEQDSAVLADFDNRTGDAVFDDSLKQALTVELSQSPFLNPLADRKIGDALRAMGQPADTRLTADVARGVCQRTGSKAVLGGTISKSSGHYELELSAMACDNGTVLAEEQGEAAAKGDVLKALSQAAMKLRAALGESSQSLQAFDIPIAAATPSLEAWKDYSVGAAMRRVKGDTPSIPLLKQAVALDPDFPLPYAELAAIYGNLRQPTQAQDYAGKAYGLRDRVNQREKFLISGIYFLETGDLEHEIQNYESWQEKYPRDYVPRNNLGNDYAQMGNLEGSLAEYQQALQLVPSVITYTNVIGMDLALNRFDAAQAALDEASARGVDGRYLRQNQYWLAFLRGNTLQMRAEVAWAIGKPGDEDTLLSMDSDTEAYYGRVHSAEDLVQRAVDSAVHAGSPETAALWRVNAALRDAEWGDVASAKSGVTQALALSQGRDVKLMAAFTLARTGDSARAKTLVAELEQEYPTDSLMKLYWLPCIAATMALDAGNPKQALQELETARPYELGAAATFINYLYPAYLRGQAYMQAHDAEAAAVEFQKLVDHPGLVSNFVTGALAHLELGRAYAMGGDKAKARAAYQAFFALWKSADAGIPILQQAKAEYAKLS